MVVAKYLFEFEVVSELADSCGVIVEVQGMEAINPPHSLVTGSKRQNGSL